MQSKIHTHSDLQGCALIQIDQRVSFHVPQHFVRQWLRLVHSYTIYVPYGMVKALLTIKEQDDIGGTLLQTHVDQCTVC